MRARINLWKHIYDHDDNAINRQVSKLAWDLAAFTCLVEIVRRAPEGETGKRLNGMYLDMLVSGFWSTTMQGVRKLVERRTIHGARGVCSIGGLLRDVKDVRHLLTRRVFVEDIAGAEYNYRATELRHWHWTLSGDHGARWAPADLRYETAKRRHELFDLLCGVSLGLSTPEDVLPEQLFDNLERRLHRLEGIVEHVNAEIAHAATEASRQGRLLDRWNLNDAKDTIRELAQIAEFVGDWFCFSGVGTVLPTPQFNQFAHLNEPLYQGEFAALHEIWDALDEEMGQWHQVDPTTYGR